MLESKKYTLNPKNWVDLHSDYLFNYTFKRIDNYDIARDIVQETFLAALKAMKNFRGQANERTWLTSILKRKIIDYYRKINSKKGKAEVKFNFYEDGDNKGNWIEERVPQTWSNEAEQNIENEELKGVLNDCVENLPEKYRTVFLLKNVQNYQTEEICNELGITSSNLWVIIHRARHQLRACLESNWFVK